MLRLELRDLADGTVEWRRECPVDRAPWTETGLDHAGPVVVEVRATATGDGGVHLRGWLAAPLRLACRRCLASMERVVELELDMLFDPAVGREEEEGQVFPMDEEASFLELGPPLRELLLLEAPAYPVCREACRGLCPVCGQDRNRDPCDCAPEAPDPRWDVLRRLQAGRSG